MHDEAEIFGALQESGARVLVIGRRALIAFGVPVMTADDDLWVHIDDIERLNRALDPLDFAPNHAPAAARARGRYVLENHDHIDVLVARQQSTVDGEVVAFDEVWARRVTQRYDATIALAVPSIPDLIRTKKWAHRAKDVADIQLLEALLHDGTA